MKKLSVKEIIINKFNKTDGIEIIPLLNSDGKFIATFSKEGIRVSNLGSQNLLKWEVFSETVELLKNNGGGAVKGDAMNGKLGDRKLPIDSVEGYIAYKVYGKTPGATVLRRISPISNILQWAGICISERGMLKLEEAYRK